MKDSTAAALASKSGMKTPFDLHGLTRRVQPAQRIAVTVAASFLLAGLAWVLLTDVVLYAVAHDRALIARIETAKGWVFVGLAGLLLYVVTLRKASSLARLRRLTAAVVESIDDGVLLLGDDRAIAHANPAAARMLHCRVEDLIGMGAVEFSRRFRVSYPDGAMVPPEKYISQLAFDEGGSLHYKAVLHLAGSDDLVISATAAPVRMKLDEPPLWVVSVMHDITASENLERLRDRFFVAAAHSIKTPVAVIKANAQALIPDVLPEHRGIVNSLERQCDRIDRLVQNLLVLARAHSRTLELYRHDMDLKPVLELVAGEPIWAYRHYVKTELAGFLPVCADKERLALVVRNLLYEASRLSLTDSPITLVGRIDDDRVAVGVCYRPLPWHEHANDIYNKYDDIGIGRSVTDTILEAHGGSRGEQTRDSEVTLWIYLPLQTGETQ